MYSLSGEGVLALRSTVDLGSEVASAVFTEDGTLFVSINGSEEPISELHLVDGQVCM